MKKIAIDVKPEYLDKKNCRTEARRILDKRLIEGMSEKQLAAEIYFHAVVYYFCEKTGLFRWLKRHADPIDICDGGDRRSMRAVFALCWKLKKK